MYYNGLFYNINNDEDLAKTYDGIEQRTMELEKLNNKIFKTNKIRQQIISIENDISGAKQACLEYVQLKIKRETEKNATLFVINTRITGLTHYQSAVKKALKHIEEETPFEKFGGLSNKEIKEDSYDCVYKYEGFFTKKFTLEREPNNPFDRYAIKVLIANNHVGYISKQENKELSNILENFNTKCSGMVSITEGPYKKYEFLQDKVITVNQNIDFNLHAAVLDLDKMT